MRPPSPAKSTNRSRERATERSLSHRDSFTTLQNPLSDKQPCFQFFILDMRKHFYLPHSVLF